MLEVKQLEAWLAVLVILLGYLVGSIPSAYILVRLAGGVDIRTVGTGNVGALNAYQRLGPAAGVAILVADVGKGVIAVFLPPLIGAPDWAHYASAVTVVAGHNWPVCLKFRGGKGAATILGVGLGLAPILAAISLAPVIISAIAIKNVVVGVAIAFTLFNVLTLSLTVANGDPPWPLTAVCLALTLGVASNYLAKSLPQIISAIRRRRWRSMVYIE